MKYRSISLNGSYNYYFNLVKYNNYYKKSLEKLKQMNKKLAEAVEQYPDIYNENSRNQSYMIYKDKYTCVGAIIINPSKDGRNLQIELQLIEEKFSPKQEIIEFMEQLVESLKLYFYDKENLVINFNNNIDLSKANDKFKKLDEDSNIYIISNKNNYILIPKLVNEINTTEKELTNWGLYWRQYLKDKDLLYHFDEELINEIYNENISLEELFMKVETIIWEEIKSKKATRNITFSRNGDIFFTKLTNRFDNQINYEFFYNVMSNNFNLKISDNKRFINNTLEIDENSNYTRIKTKYLNIIDSKDNNHKTIDYTSPIIDNSSISVVIRINEQNEIEYCYIDFRTHKNDGRIKGLYALRISSQRYFDNFSLRFINRKGYKDKDFKEDIFKNDEKVFTSIIDENITIELIDELIRKIIPIVNNHANINNKQTISLKHENAISNMINEKVQAINYVKNIKGEIPLPKLQSNLEKFISENGKNKESNKMKVLK